MSDKEIFKKAIKKAQANGMKVDWLNGLLEDVIDELWNIHIYKIIIFNIKFAKSFWGEIRHEYHPYPMQGHFDKDACCFCGDVAHVTKQCWKHHLQEMIIKQEPLKYLEKFL